MSLLPSTPKSQLVPIVRRVVKSKKQERFHEYVGICYSTALDNMRKFFDPLVGEVKQFVTHSMKVVALATQVSNQLIQSSRIDTLVGRPQTLS